MSLASTTNRIDYTGNGATSVYSFPFKIFAKSELQVTVRNTSNVETTLVLNTDYTIPDAGVGSGAPSGSSITLVSAGQAWLTAGNLTSNYKLSMRRVRALTQETDIRNQGDFYPEVHENQFDKLVMNDQQQQDEIDRSLRMPETVPVATFSPELPATFVGANRCVVRTNSSGNGFELGPSSTDIENAATNAAAAAVSATNAATSATNAATSETNAAASAASAAASLASAFFRDVVYITNADSPYTITQALHNGKLISINSSGGAVAITMPEISTLTPPFNVGFLINTAGNNVTISRSGTDTIAGATTKVFSAVATGCQLVADTGAAPDDYSVMDFGSVADGSVTYAKLNSQVVNGATTVTLAPAADYMLISDGSDSNNVKKALLPVVPTKQILTGTGTYTTPANCRYIIVKMVGAGGGGAGSGAGGYGGGASGTTGSNTLFKIAGGAAILTANGGVGAGGITTVYGASGGGFTVGAPAIDMGSSAGGNGGGGYYNGTANGSLWSGGYGGASIFGSGGSPGGGAGGSAGTVAGSGGAGGGASNNTGIYTGVGGGAGGYVEALISSPSATYDYVVPASGGAGGTTGDPNGYNGGAGAAGYMVVEEYYI
jgi:hypothetical protein